jgi:hypothetical protein
MKKVIIAKFITFDNKEFNTEKEAKKHLIKLESDLITKMSAGVIDTLTDSERLKKLSSISTFINDNLDSFVLLKQIQNDMLLIDEDEDNN